MNMPRLNLACGQSKAPQGKKHLKTLSKAPSLLNGI